MKVRLEELKRELEQLQPVEGLSRISKEFSDSSKFSSALGMEDQIITYWIGRENLAIQIFTLDTGRMFQEAYDLLDLTVKKYKVNIKVLFPDSSKVEQMVSGKGINSFYDSMENRKECCHIRKVEPLNRALQNTKIWITGIRADQSINRKRMEMVEWDENYHVIKYNPLMNWRLEEVENYIKANHIPINALHNKGYASIGCAPCTRAIVLGEDVRAGRWWWENSAKECGLHAVKKSVNDLRK